MNTIMPKCLPCFSSLIAANEGCDNHLIVSPSGSELVQHCCRAGLNERKWSWHSVAIAWSGVLTPNWLKGETVTFGILIILYFYLNLQKFLRTNIRDFKQPLAFKYYFKGMYFNLELFLLSFYRRWWWTWWIRVRIESHGSFLSFSSWLFSHGSTTQSVLFLLHQKNTSIQTLHSKYRIRADLTWLPRLWHKHRFGSGRRVCPSVLDRSPLRFGAGSALRIRANRQHLHLRTIAIKVCVRSA